MLQPEIEDRIDRWTKILAGWFMATNAAAHLNHRCSADDVSYDLMACLSGLVREQKEKEQDALDRVGATLRLYHFSNIEMVFREMIHEPPPPHSTPQQVDETSPEPPPEEPTEYHDLWIQPFPCQRRACSFNGRSTQRLLANLLNLIVAWYEDAKIAAHWDCDLASCAFNRGYTGMMLWTVCSVSCLRYLRERIGVARLIDHLLTEHGAPPVFGVPDPVLEAAQNLVGAIDDHTLRLQQAARNWSTRTGIL